MSEAVQPATGFYKYFPAFDSLRKYGVADLRADFIAGLTVAAVAVPQAMAYGLAAGVDPAFGLYTAIVMTAVGAVFDSSKQLINGPTNATSIAVLSATAMYAADQRMSVVVLLGFLIGSLQLIISLLRLGDLTRLISHSVVVGFTAGAGTLLILDQLKNLFGMQGSGDPHSPFIVRLWTVLSQGTVHGPTFCVGLASIVFVLLLRWLKKKLSAPLFPELLVVVIASAAVTHALGLQDQGVKVVGAIPASLPSFQMPKIELALVQSLSSSAFAIGLLGLLEALAMAKGIAAHTGQRLDLNQQCLSEGLANLSGSFFQCIPGSGSLTRSAINQQAGARTQWSGVWSALAVAIIILLFAPWARFVPRSALAGLLMVTALRMIDWKAIGYSVRATRFDTIIIVSTAFSAVFISIEFCILIGVMLSFVMAVPRVGRMLLTEFVAGDSGHVHERLASDSPDPEMLIFGLEGEMFFAAGPALETHLDTIEARIDSRVKIVILRVKRVRNPDAVGMHMLDGFVRRLHQRGVHVLLCGIREELSVVFEKTGLVDLIHPDHFFREQPVRETSTAMALRQALKILGRQPLTGSTPATPAQIG